MVLAAVASAVAGCATGDVTTRVTATVYAQGVVCDPDGVCRDDGTGVVVEGERLDVTGILSAGASRNDPGLYLYAAGFRSGGAFFELEMDVPVELGADLREVDASYREYLAGTPLFRSERVGGELQVVPIGSGDDRYAGVFDLRFTDPGPDAALDTADDRTRVLRFGAFTLTGTEPETPRRPYEVPDDGVYVDVEIDVVIDDPAYDYPYDACDDGTQGYGEGTGCEGNTSTDPGPASGCEGDTTGDVGSGGCEGDTTGGGGGSGADCGGDTTGGSGGSCFGSGGGGCEGDSLASGSSAASHRRPTRSVSAALPILGLVATRFLLRRPPRRR